MASKGLGDLPSVSDLLEYPPLKGAIDRVSRSVVVARATSMLDRLRREVTDAASETKIPTPADLAASVARWILKERQPTLRPVINATGHVLSDKLAGPPLAAEAIAEMQAAAAGYALLDAQQGDESVSCESTVQRLLKELSGAGEALVFNSDVAAMTLALATLSENRHTVIARTDLVAIGRDYEVPKVIEASGAKLCEVGTTNRVSHADFEAAANPLAGAFLVVHHGGKPKDSGTNTGAVCPDELARLAHRKRITHLEDLGCGGISSLSGLGIDGWPAATERIAAGANVVLVRGNRLLGGPSCGILLGGAEYLGPIKKHRLYLGSKADEFRLAALAATLRLYHDLEAAEPAVPTLSLLSTSIENLRHRAARIAPQLAGLDAVAAAQAVDTKVCLTGTPSETASYESCCVEVTPAGMTAEEMAGKLLRQSPAVLTTWTGQHLRLDLRSVLPHQDSKLIAAFEALLSEDGETETGDGSPNPDGEGGDNSPSRG